MYAKHPIVVAGLKGKLPTTQRSGNVEQQQQQQMAANILYCVATRWQRGTNTHTHCDDPQPAVDNCRAAVKLKINICLLLCLPAGAAIHRHADANLCV